MKINPLAKPGAFIFARVQVLLENPGKNKSPRRETAEGDLFSFAGISPNRDHAIIPFSIKAPDVKRRKG
ncbi:MAG: hypothetical protein JW973_18470, partial [Bacteroidales bacterium]|nr:hypothetical protein [Bacteroidales bacterium]